MRKRIKSIGYSITIVTCIALLVLAGIFGFQEPESSGATGYTIEQKWELPEILNEVSGIAWIKGGKIACVQDEKGTIFIYDIHQKKIVSEIDFSGPGNYEGIALAGDTAYVMRSDGKIFEVTHFLSETPTTLELATPFSSDNNMETLAINAAGTHLLIVPKDKGVEKGKKGVYRISLTSKQPEKKPYITITMSDTAFADFRKKKLYKTFRPSDLAVHPTTGAYYILEGIDPKLLILKPEGTIKKVYKLNKDTFAQPEGITFSSDGTLYISNEAGDGPSTLLKIRLNNLLNN